VNRPAVTPRERHLLDPFPQPQGLRLQSDATMRHKVTLIPGEGIGLEVAGATRRILEAAGVQIEWEEIVGRAGESSD